MRSAAIALAAVMYVGAGFSQPTRITAPTGGLKPAPTSLDSGWTAAPAEGVAMSIKPEDGALRIDFDFQGRGGYAIARREGVIELPDNFEFTFRLRGNAPRNTLEFKLVDESGENVWWTTRRDFDFAADWRRISIKKRQLTFAWGPLGGGEVPKRVGAVEIVITAGTGGKGTVWLDDITLAPLETTQELPPPFGPFNEREVTLDLERRREFGGLTIDWTGRRPAYTVETSIDGSDWELVRTVAAGSSRRDFIAIENADARFVRLRSAGEGIRTALPIARVALQPIEWSKTPNDFFASMARESKRGEWPRYLYGEQSYWTVVGEDGARVEALINEDGAVEAGDARFSIEPFLLRDGTLTTWADVTATQSLERGYLPIPSVAWGESLQVTAFVDSSTLYVRYRTQPGTRLVLAVRPFQVNPPWQFLARIGGVAPISRIAWDGKSLTVDGQQTATITPSVAPVGFTATTFDDGNIVESIRTGFSSGAPPTSAALADPYNYASAALAFDASDVTIAVPLENAPARSPAVHGTEAVAAKWAAKLDRVSIDIPDRDLANSILSNIAYILINRDGPGIQPGSRSYDRSWIRDGSLTSAALLRLGHTDPVKEFIEWYAGYQQPNGRIPCCVGRPGADPVPEHDSHGQFIYLIAEYYRFTNDRQLLARMWPRIVRTVDAIDALRRERMTPKYVNTVFYGLVPESISHEGYSAKAMHSYWDDLFILRGLKDATFIATELGEKAQGKRIAAIRDEFRTHLVASIRRAMTDHKIEYIPGSAELGDFDATSTTVYVSPGEEYESLPSEALLNTFDRYYAQAFAPRDYTPYEWRNVGALLRLGRRTEARELVSRLFLDQRPAGWNHWAEVVYADLRKPGFIGDMPHTWVGSDFIRSILDMFAYERESDQALVVGAGVPPRWLTQGINIKGLRTWYGPLNLSMQAEDKTGVRVRIEGVRVPPGGIVVVSPLDGHETVIRKLPANVVIPSRSKSGEESGRGKESNE